MVESDVILGPVNYLLMVVFIVVATFIVVVIGIGIARDRLRQRGRDFRWLTSLMENYVIRPQRDVSSDTGAGGTATGRHPVDELISVESV